MATNYNIIQNEVVQFNFSNIRQLKWKYYLKSMGKIFNKGLFIQGTEITI